MILNSLGLYVCGKCQPCKKTAKKRAKWDGLLFSFYFWPYPLLKILKIQILSIKYKYGYKAYGQILFF